MLQDVAQAALADADALDAAPAPSRRAPCRATECRGARRKRSRWRPRRRPRTRRCRARRTPPRPPWCARADRGVRADSACWSRAPRPSNGRPCGGRPRRRRSGRITLSMKCASISENVPRGSPGKQRFRSRLSIGESRVSLSTAGTLTAGIMMTRPCTCWGHRASRASRETGDLALVFVAVDSAREQHGRACAVLHDDDRDLDRAPAGGIARQRRAQVAGLTAVPIEVDLAADSALARQPPLRPPTFCFVFRMMVYDLRACQAA